MPAPALPTLGSPGFLAAKAGLSAAAALAGCALLGNEDRVSATFVAVVCVSPTVLIGARRSAGQLAGSALGGALGTLAMELGVPAGVGIPAAVAAAVYGALRAGLGATYVVAAFTALFVQAVPRGVPAHTLGVRMEAVVIAVIAAFLVNWAVSGRSYASIFRKRLDRVERYADEVLVYASYAGPDAFLPAFTLLAAVREELTPAIEELRWRGSPDLAAVRGEAARAERVGHLLHVAMDAQKAADEAGLERTVVADLVRWAADGGGPPPEVPEALAGSGRRVAAARRAIRPDASPGLRR